MQSDWLRTFWSISQEQRFSQIWDLCRNTVNNAGFHIEQIQWKLMPKFFNKFWKSCFWPILVHFPNFVGKNVFLGNPALSLTTSYGFLAPCQNLEKNDDTVSRKPPNRQKDGQKDRWKDVQTLFYRTLLATPEGPIMQERSRKSCSLKYIKVWTN